MNIFQIEDWCVDWIMYSTHELKPQRYSTLILFIEYMLIF